MVEPNGLDACYLTVRCWMQWQRKFKQINHTSISTDYRHGDGRIRLSDPFQRRNGRHQLTRQLGQGRTPVRPYQKLNSQHISFLAVLAPPPTSPEGGTL